jgi:hypothetical protein
MKNKHLNIEGKQNTSTRFELERNDCTVRAYAEAFEIPYADAHVKLLLAGRRIRHGANFEQIMGKLHPDIISYPRPHMTVGKFIALFCRRGNWIIKIKGHVFAVKDRVIFDMHPEANINCHVISAWFVSIPLKEIE